MKNTKEKTQMTNEELAKKMGIKKIAKKTQNIPLSKTKEIKARINKVVEDMLLDEFSEYFYEINTQAFVQTKDDEFSLEDRKGYYLVLPKNNFEINGEKHNGFMIGKPTTYIDGATKVFTINANKVGETRNNK